MLDGRFRQKVLTAAASVLRRERLGAPITAVCSAAVAVATVVTSCSASPAGVVDGRAEIVSERRIGERLVELDIDADGVGRTRVRLLVPSSFDDEPGRRWPVLYLLHGGDGSYLDWTEGSDVEALTEGLDLLVVMPDSGPGATYVDWVFASADSRRPQYETYMTEQLPELLRSAFRADDRAAIAGLSAGGFGAFSFASRHPDRYLAAASFSGNLDTRDGDEIGPWLTAIPTLALEHAFPLGDPLTHEVRWRGHNPLDLVPNLAELDLYVSGGDGQLGPLSRPTEIPDFIMLESATERRSKRFVERAEQLGVDVTSNFYGPGTHTFAYWNREFAAALPMLVAALEQGRPDPPAFTHRFVEDDVTVWGWTFTVTGRDAPAFTDVSIDGDSITATGNGRLTVTAPTGATATLELGGTAERYTSGVDEPGPRPTGPPATGTI